MYRVTTALIGLLCLSVPLASFAQDQKPVEQPAGADAAAPDTGAGEFVVTVAEVAGTVEVQSGGQGDWVPAVVGMRFGEGTKVCTGFKSGVILEFGDSSFAMLKDLAQASVDRLFKGANAVDAQLSLTVGRVAVYVKKQEIRTEFRVSTPKLTAAVKGSFLDFEYSPDYGPWFYTATGDVVVTDPWGASQQIGEPESAQQERAIVCERVMYWNEQGRELGQGMTGVDLLIKIFGKKAEPEPDAPETETYSDIDRRLQTSGTAPIHHEPPIIAERSMYRNYGGSHMAERTFYFAEGTTRPGFDPWSTLHNPGTTNDNAISSGLPAYSSSQFGAQVDQLYSMGYSGLAYYLRFDGPTCPAVGDVSCFSSSHSSEPAKIEWMWGVVDSSPYGPTLRAAYGGP